MRRAIALLALALFSLLAACSQASTATPTAIAPVGSSPQMEATVLPTAQAPTPAAPATPTANRPTVASHASPPLPQTATIATPATPAPITFAAIGDYGWSGRAALDVAALVDKQDPDLVITLGDNNYPIGAPWSIAANISANYGRFIAAGRFFPALGNHDLTLDRGQAYFDFFDLPGNERYYDFVRGDVHFFALNSDWREPDGIRADSAQADWLEKRLRASTSSWQVVYFHAPPFVSYSAKQVPVMDWPFAAWGADLVLSGHAHLYERLEINGITYIVNGLGGYTIYPFDDVPQPGSQARYNANFGALFVEATGDSLRGQFLSRGGQTVDSWSIAAPRQTE